MARIIESTLGHENQISKLQRLIEVKRFPQSSVFVGPSGIGKKRVALAMTQALVCEKNQSACGQCGPCLRIEKQQSESLHIVQTDPEYSKPLIKVDDIRRMLDALSLAPAWAARVVIIDSAQLMNDQASNALLKNLEEPGENTYFILIADELTQLLPTIRSRVQVTRFFGLATEHLKKLKPNLPDWAYQSCRGRLDQLENLTSKQGLAERNEALELLEMFCFDKNFLLQPGWRKSLTDDREFALFNMKCWLQIVRDAMVLKTGVQSFLLNTDQIDFLKKMSQFSEAKLNYLSSLISTASSDISGYQDASLVVDSMWVKHARVD